MRELDLDSLVIGGGAAGLAASLSLSKRGFSTALVDREPYMGGILLQCIHNGFGLRHFGEELTGPEFARRLERDVVDAGIPFHASTTVLSLARDQSGSGFDLLLSSATEGVYRVRSRSVVLAMGSRERNRGNIRIAGTRPAGVFTAGLVQQLINIDGFVPGKKAVIIGSGDIGLIMARRLTLSGVKVAGVVEIQSFPSGLTRNIVQCLDDFGIPLHLSHATLRILGNDRVSGVEVAPLEGGAVRQDRAFTIPCDTVLLSVGLVPENELSAKAGVALNPVTGGPSVDSRLMTSVPGVFAAGNVLHIHDLVDNVVEEASRAGDECALWLERLGVRGTREVLSASGVLSPGETTPAEVPVRAGINVRYTVPSSMEIGSSVTLSLRSMVAMDSGLLKLERNGRAFFTKKLSFVRPGEMITVQVPALPCSPSFDASPVEVSIADVSGGAV